MPRGLNGTTNRQFSAASTLQRNGQRLVGAMKNFAALWPHLVDELGTEPDARNEYLALHDRLRTDDLPATRPTSASSCRPTPSTSCFVS